jgi:hypothetical protein
MCCLFALLIFCLFIYLFAYLYVLQYLNSEGYPATNITYLDFENQTFVLPCNDLKTANYEPNLLRNPSFQNAGINWTSSGKNKIVWILFFFILFLLFTFLYVCVFKMLESTRQHQKLCFHEFFLSMLICFCVFFFMFFVFGCVFILFFLTLFVLCLCGLLGQTNFTIQTDARLGSGSLVLTLTLTNETEITAFQILSLNQTKPYAFRFSASGIVRKYSFFYLL